MSEKKARSRSQSRSRSQLSQDPAFYFQVLPNGDINQKKPEERGEWQRNQANSRSCAVPSAGLPLSTSTPNSKHAKSPSGSSPEKSKKSRGREENSLRRRAISNAMRIAAQASASSSQVTSNDLELSPIVPNDQNKMSLSLPLPPTLADTSVEDSRLSDPNRTRDRSAARQLFNPVETLSKTGAAPPECILREPLLIVTHQAVETDPIEGQIRFFSESLIWSRGGEKNSSDIFHEKKPYVDSVLEQKESSKLNSHSSQQVYIGADYIIVQRITTVETHHFCRGQERNKWKTVDSRCFKYICKGRIIGVDGSDRSLSHLSVIADVSMEKDQKGVEKSERLLISFDREALKEGTQGKQILGVRLKEKSQVDRHVKFEESVSIGEGSALSCGFIDIRRKASVRTSSSIWGPERIRAVEDFQYREQDKNALTDQPDVKTAKEKTTLASAQSEPSQSVAAPAVPVQPHSIEDAPSIHSRHGCSRPAVMNKNDSISSEASTKTTVASKLTENTATSRDKKEQISSLDRDPVLTAMDMTECPAVQPSSQSRPVTSAKGEGKSSPPVPKPRSVFPTFATRNEEKLPATKILDAAAKGYSNTPSQSGSSVPVGVDQKKEEIAATELPGPSPSAASSTNNDISVVTETSMKKTKKAKRTASQVPLQEAEVQPVLVDELGVLVKTQELDATINGKNWRLTTTYKIHGTPGRPINFSPQQLRIDGKTLWQSANYDPAPFSKNKKMKQPPAPPPSPAPQ